MTLPRSPWTPEQPDTPNVVPDPEPVTEPQPVRAEHDLLIPAPHLGPGAAVLVNAGDPMPPGLPVRDPGDQPPAKRRRR